ncbi:MAG: BatD family protein [Thermoanaerobaculia bacterium]
MRVPVASAAGLLLALLTASGAARAADVQVRARLEPQRIGVEDVVQLTIEVQGGALDDLGLQPDFELENLQVAGGQVRSSQLSAVNGRVSRVESIQLPLRPLEVGTGRVHAIEVEVGGEVFTPDDLEVEIVEGSVAPPARTRRDPWGDPFPDIFAPLEREVPAAEPKLFLRAEAYPRDPYVGQQVTYTLYLFSQSDVSSVHPESLPDFRGFWVQEVDDPQPREPDIVEVDGEKYARVPLLRRMLFPLHAGEISIDPVRIQVSVSPRRLGFGRIQRGIDVWRTTNPSSFEVRALPEAPAGFQGAVGQLKVAAELHPAEVAVGEAATFTVTLSGVGHLQGLPAPSAPVLDGVRGFPPQQESDERVVGNHVQARKSWSWVLLPDRPGEWTIPPTRIPYFDPDEEEFRWATAAAQDLTATQAENEPVAPASPATDTSPPASGGQAPPEAGATSPAWTAPATRIATVALLACGVGLLALLLWRRRAAPGRASAARLRQALQEARHAGDTRRAAAGIEEALRRLLETRWQIGPGTASTRWPDLLGARGMATETATAVGRLGDDLHYLRYAPQLADADELLQDVLRRGRKLSRALE